MDVTGKEKSGEETITKKGRDEKRGGVIRGEEEGNIER